MSERSDQLRAKILELTAEFVAVRGLERGEAVNQKGFVSFPQKN